MQEMYETKITDIRWVAYDLPGNIGWITWIVCLVFCLKKGTDMYSVLAIIPAVLMIVGVIELISERIAGLDRILSKRRLLRGFGALTFGGILGVPISLAGILSADHRISAWIMLSGAILYGFFAGLLLKGYKKKV